MTRKNKTSVDALIRVQDARVSCLVGAEEEYLLALKRHVQDWLESIDRAIALRKDDS